MSNFDHKELYVYEPKPHGMILLAIISAILVVVVLATATKAETMSTQCSHGTCTTHVFEIPTKPRIIIVPEDNSPEAEDRYQKWQSFCKPQEETRAYGVRYLVYAHEGCEYGRSE
jgi:hypothetical protein